MKESIQQGEAPESEKEAKLSDILTNSKDSVRIGRFTFRMGWTRFAARRKLSDILSNEKDEMKVIPKCAAALLLNRRWWIWLFYWVVWRWFYYVEEYTEEEYLEFIALCKKKADATTYYVLMVCLRDMRDTMEKRTRADAERILQKQR